MCSEGREFFIIKVVDLKGFIFVSAISSQDLPIGGLVEVSIALNKSSIKTSL
jgi:hypothetical protein